MCAACRTTLPAPPQCCYSCQTQTESGIICRACSGRTELHSVRASTLYAGAAKKLVWQLKANGIQQAAKLMADVMADHLGTDNLLLVPIPTATTRRRQRGYDQSVLLARNVARVTRLPYANCLARLGQAHQVGSTRAQRLRQLQQAFRVRRSQLVNGRHVVLIDDVITTGASVEAAASVLYQAGAKSVQALAFAQAIKKAPEGP